MNHVNPSQENMSEENMSEGNMRPPSLVIGLGPVLSMVNPGDLSQENMSEEHMSCSTVGVVQSGANNVRWELSPRPTRQNMEEENGNDSSLGATTDLDIPLEEEAALQLLLIATRDICPGEEVLLDYLGGSRGESELQAFVLHHGVVPYDSP
eukprot:gene22926-30107_t